MIDAVNPDNWADGNVQEFWTSEEAVDGGQFGYKVAVDNNTLVVGSFGVNDVFVYERENSTWIEKVIWHPPEASEFSYFGIGVGVLGDLIIGLSVYYGTHDLRRVNGEWDLAGSYNRSYFTPYGGLDMVKISPSGTALIICDSYDDDYDGMGSVYMFVIEDEEFNELGALRYSQGQAGLLTSHQYDAYVRTSSSYENKNDLI